MIRKEFIRKSGAVALSAAMALGAAVPAFAVGAGSSAAHRNDQTKGVNDGVDDHDIIDMDATGSIHIFKYDTTSAEAAGDYHEGDIKATGQQDTGVSGALADYAIKGVEFSYLKVGDIRTWSSTTTGEAGNSQIEVVYGIPTALQQILNGTNDQNYLPADAAVDMWADTVAEPAPASEQGKILYYTSTQLSDALKAIIDADNISAKNALESYLVNYQKESSTSDDEQLLSSGVLTTDAKGEASVNGLPLGLYLIVETKVPEEVTSTVNPWLVSLPFTNVSKQTTKDDHDHESAIDPAHPETGYDHTDSRVASDDNHGGDYWLYNFYAYPKNQTGNPSLDKSVRNAYSKNDTEANTKKRNTAPEGSASTFQSALAEKRGTEGLGGNNILLTTANGNTSKDLVVFNAKDGVHDADTDAAAYVKNRGGYTGNVAGGGEDYSKDFTYGDVTTASEGDVLDYIVVSKLPHITSKATYLSQYTFTDVLGRGITYNNDPRIAFYDNKDDAMANNTANAKLIWNYTSNGEGATGSFGKDYANVLTDQVEDGRTKMTITMTEAGLNVINHEANDASASSVTDVTKGLSDYYMVLYYTATVESNEQVTLGDEGNQNDVSLTWSRTSDKDQYFNTLQDRNYVYTYGVDLTKTFSKNDGNFSDVQFKLYNNTDAYYIIADKAEDGVYYVSGKSQDKKDATILTPDANGKLYIKGLEADKYELTEIQTTDGYTLLKDPITFEVVSTERDVKAAVAGTVGLDADAAANIIEHYGTSIKLNPATGELVTDNSKETGIKNEDEQFVNNTSDEVKGTSPAGAPAVETANGRTIGKTDMYVGAIKPATGTVDGKACTLLKSSTGDTNSADAEVKMTVLNQKGWNLPQTGGAGLYLITILGVIAVSLGFALSRKKEIQG